MDLLRLGSQARKTGYRPRSGLAKDRYDMEDVDEFFADDDTTIMHNATSEILRRSSSGQLKPQKGRGVKEELNNVARKINFTEAEAESFKLSPIGLSSKGRTNKNKKSPLRSPLQEKKQQQQQQQQKRKEAASTHSPQQLFVDDESDSIEFPEEIDNDIHEKYDDILPGEDLTLSPIPISSINATPISPPVELISSKKATSLTKKMALSRPSTKRPTAKSLRPTRKPKSAAPKSNLTSLSKTNLISPPDENNASLSTSKPANSKPKIVPPQETITKPSPLPSPPPDGLRRSKRIKIAPLAFWRNERIVYSRAYEDYPEDEPDQTLIKDIRQVPLQEIKEVVHIPEQAAYSPKISTTSSSRKRSRLKTRSTPPKLKSGGASETKEVYDYESDPEISGSEWFKDKFKNIEIFTNNKGDKLVKPIVFAPDFGEFQKAPNDDDTDLADDYKVATLFNNKLTGGGLLEFPFEGYRSLRTSGNSVFMCHVVKGLIEVSLSNDSFVVTRGCSFEIPKSNFYAFRNIGQGPAKIFFVQAADQDSEDEDEEDY